MPPDRADLSCTRSMSSRRQRVLEAVRRHFREVGASPSHREIAERVGMPAQHVGKILRFWQTAGALALTARVPRSILLVGRGHDLSDTELEAACHARGWKVTKSDLPALVEAHPLPAPAEGVTEYGLHLLDALQHIE